MSIFTANSWDVKSLHQGLNTGLRKGSLLFLLAFIWFSALAGPNNSTSSFTAAAPMAAFDDCNNNLLNNGAFDSDLSEWTIGMQAIGASSSIGGSNAAYVFPNGGQALFYQDVFVSEGFDYTLNFRAGTHDPAANQEIGIQFYDINGDLISTSSEQIDHNIDTNGALQAYSITATAPASTHFLKVIGSTDNGFLRMDDFCLTTPPDENASPPTFNPACLLNNYSFEGDISSWNVNSSTTHNVATTYATHGIYAAWIRPNSTSGTAQIYQDFAVTPGETFTLDFYAATDNVNATQKIGFQFLNSSGSVISTEDTEVDHSNTTGGLTSYSLNATTPIGATQVRVFGNSNAGTLFMDDFCLSKTGTASAICGITLNCWVNVNGVGWVNSCTTELCTGGNLRIGTQTGLQSNVSLIYPNGATDETPDGDSYFTINDIAQFGTYKIRYRDDNGCDITKDFNITNSCSQLDPTASPAVSTSCGYTSWATCDGSVLSSSSLSSSTSYNTNESYRPCGIEVTSGCNVVSSERWHCIDYDLSIPTAYIQYTQTNYSGVGLTALQASRMNWIICNYDYNQSGVGNALWKISGTGGSVNTIYNAAVNAIPSADGSQHNMVFYKSSISTVQDFVQYKCQGAFSCDVTVNAGQSQIVCQGENATLTATANGGTSPFTYEWKEIGTTSNAITIQAESGNVGGGAQVETVQSNYNGSGYVEFYAANGEYSEVTVNVPQAGAYTFEVRYSYSSDATVNMQLRINGAAITNTASFVGTGSTGDWQTQSFGPYNFDAGANTIRFESNESTGVDIDEYVFNFSETLTGNSISVSPSTETLYEVTITDNNGCTAKDNINVSVINAPNTRDDNYSLCCGETINDNVGDNDNGLNNPIYAITQDLSGDGTVILNNDGSFTYTPGSCTEDQFTYKVCNDNNIEGCCNEATVTLTIRPEPIITIDISDPEICAGESITVSASTTGGVAPYTYEWDNGLESNSTNTVSPITNTTYRVTVTDANGCTSTEEASVVIGSCKYDLALIKVLADAQASTVSLGEEVTYKIRIRNQGEVPSNNYSVTDQIPAGMSFVSANNGGTENAGIVTWEDLPNLDPTQTKTLTLVLKVEDATQSNYRNWAEISEDSSEDYNTTDEDSSPDTNVGNDNAAGLDGLAPNDAFTNHNDLSLDEPANDEDDNDYEDISLDVKYDLALIKTLATGQAATVSIGDQVSYNITVSNQGNVPSNDYSVTDQIPAGMSFVSASDSGTESTGIVTWTGLANLNPGQTKVLVLALRVDDATQSDYRNWAEISEDSAEDYGTTDEDSTPDTNVGNDNAADVTGIAPNDAFTNHNDITLDEPANDEDDNDYEDVTLDVVYDLALIKTLGNGQPTAVSIGDNVVYEITIANQGNVPSNEYSIRDKIPLGMSFVSASDGGTVGTNSRNVNWSNLPTLNAGQTKTLAIILRVDDATQSDYRNWAEISDDSAEDYGVTDEDSTPDTNVGNDNASGLGTDPNDEVTNHNDITLDDPAGDEDDNDYEDVTLDVKYDLALINELGPGQATTVALGELVTFKVTVTNQGNVPSNDYTITNQLPAGTSFVSASDGGTESAGIVTWANLANLDPAEMRMFTIVVRVDDATQSDYRIWSEISEDSAADYGTTDEDSTPDANVGNDNAAGTTGISPNDDFVNHNDISLDEPANDEDDNDYEDITLEVNYDLALVKTLGNGQPTTVGLGDNIVYEITIANQGNVPSNDYTVTDQIPAGMSFVSASDAGAESGGIVTWASLPNLNPAQTKTLAIVLRVDNAAQSDYRNWAEISDDSSEDYGTTDEDSTPDTNVGNDNASGLGTDPNDDATNHNDITLDEPANDEDDNDYEDITLEVKYDLALIKTLGAGQSTAVNIGDLVTYSITVSNQGNVPSNDYTVTDQIPAGMSFISASDAGAENAGVVTWTSLPNLNAGQTKVLSLILRVEDATQSDYRNWAEISDDSSEDYGTTDEDSTPDTNVGDDNANGLGTDPNDAATNHNDITLDEPAGDEDDNDYEDVTLIVNYDLALIKTLAAGQPSSVAAGDNVNFTITVSNQGNVASNDYTVVDVIPAGMSFVSASDGGSASGNVITWASLPNIAPGASKTLDVTLRLDDATVGQYINKAEISDDSSEDYGTTDEDSTPDADVDNDPVVNHNDPSLDDPTGDEDDNDIEEIMLGIEYDLALIKTLSAGQSAIAGQGDNVSYDITVSNQGNVESLTYSVTDQIPDGMSFVSATDNGTESNGVVTWSNLTSLPTGATETLTIVLQVTDVTKGDFRNWAEISDDSANAYNTTDEDSTPDNNTGNDNAAGLGTGPNDLVDNHNDITLDNPTNDEDDNDFEDIQAAIKYDLALIKTLGAGQPAMVSIGDVVVYSITVANQGNVPSNTYTVTDQIPAGMSLMTTTDGGVESNGVVTWALPNLAPGATKVINLILRVDNATQSDFRNWAEISSDSASDYGTTDEDSTPDSNVGNDNTSGFGIDPNDPFTNHNDITLDEPAGDEDDNDYEDIQLDIQYDLALVKTLADGQAATVNLGEVVNYEITIANQGNVPSSDYTVTDQIPAGMEFVSASDFGAQNSGIVTWSNLANLAPGQTKTLTITLRVTNIAQSDYRNWAEISDDSSEDYGVTDEDSTPDANVGNDNTSGTGVDPNDPFTNHNDITLDEPTGDEDDNDYEDVAVNVSYDLALVKTLAAGQDAAVSLGDVVNFTIIVANQGNVPSNDYAVTDQIPAGMTFVSASDFGAASGNTVTWSNLANLAPGQTKTLTIALRVTDVAQAPFTNFAEISDDSSEDYGVTDEDSTPDTDPTNDPLVETDDPTVDQLPGDEDDSDSEAVDVNINYDLALIKTLAVGQDATVSLGEVVNYNITIANQGNVPSNDYTVTDQIPAGMEFVSASDFGANSSGIVTWASLANLAPGQTKVLTIALRVTDIAQSDYRNWAEISDDSSEDYGTTDEDSTPDNNTGNDNTDGTGVAPNDPATNHNDITLDEPAGDEDDNDYEDVGVNVVYDLALIKTLAAGQAATVSAGDIVKYNITVSNQGNVASNDYNVSDVIPAGMSFISASDFGSLSGSTVTWTNLANIAPGQTKVLTLDLRLVDPSLGSYINRAEISDDSSEDYGVTDEDSTPDTDVMNDPVVNHNDPNADTVPGDEDDNDLEEIAVTVNYDLALIKTLAAGQSATVEAGELVSYAITVANQGNVPSGSYVVTDQIPAGMSFVNASDGGAAAGSIVTWSNLPDIAAGQTKALSITLRVDDITKGDFRNWAEISDDSSEDYGTTDEDSTPDNNVGNDDDAGTGAAPNDAVTNHNDITLDEPAGDEDDNDYEDVQAQIIYDLALIKTLAEGQTAVVALGDNVSYEITISNQGNVPSGSYVITDQIPTGMSFVNASDGGTLSGANVTWTSLPSLDAGGRQIVSLTLKVDAISQDGYRNIAEISDDASDTYNVTDEDSTPDDNLTNDPTVNHNDPLQDNVPGDEDDNDYEDVQVILEYDLALIKTLSEGQATTVSEGAIVSYDITIANQGNVPSNDYSVTDQIPAGMSFVKTTDFGIQSGSTITWASLPNLAPGETKTLTLQLKVDNAALGDYRNWAEISDDSSEDYGLLDNDSSPNTSVGNDSGAGLGQDPDDLFTNHNDISLDEPANDEDDNDYEDIFIQVEYDLALVKLLAAGQPTAVFPGQVVNFEIIVTNQGNVPSNDYTVIDGIPTGMSFVSASDFGSVAGSTVTWANLPNLNPGETKVLTVALRLEDATIGEYKNIAEISDDSSEDYGVTDEDSTPDTNLTNDQMVNHNDISQDVVDGDEDDNDFETIQTITSYDLALIKTLSVGQSANVSAGEQVSYDITITNQGSLPSGAYDVVDQIPAGMSLVFASDFGSAAGSTITWSNLPNINPGETKVVKIILRLEDPSLVDYINRAEISADSASDFGTSDEDSTPDSDLTNDPVVDHNDPNQDTVPGDEDDNDIEEITPIINYDLALIKTLADGQAVNVAEGDVVNYTITVTNQGDVASNAYAVVDEIPTGMSFVSASDNGANGGNTVMWIGLQNLEPNETKTLSITLRMDDVTLSSYRNWAEIADDSSEAYGTTDEDSTPDANVNNDQVINHNDPTLDTTPGDEDDNDYEDVFPILPQPVYDLALIKTLSEGQANSVAVGETVAYSITVINQGTVPSNNYTVTDAFPTGMSFITASDLGNNAANTVTWADLPNLNPGEMKVLTLTLRLDDISQATYRNYAEISDDSSEDYGVTDEDSTPDSNPSNDPAVNHNDPNQDTVAGDEDDSDYEDINALASYDLALIKTLATGQATSVGSGETVTYTITVTNQGTVPSNDFSVVDQIPAGMSFISASDFGSIKNEFVTWFSLPNLNPGESKMLTVTLRMDDPTLGGTYRNWAEIANDSSEDYGVTDEDSTPDTNVTNDPVTNHNDVTLDTTPADEDDNDYEDITPILPTPVYDLALIKTLSTGQATSVEAGQPVSYTITVSNQGTVASNDYTVIDQIPAGMSFLSASDNGAAAGNVVTWSTLPSIEPGQTQQLTIVLQMDNISLSQYRNWAEISEDSANDYGVADEDSTPDSDVTNDPAVNHNDPNQDTVSGDEDDNDYEDILPIQPAPIYDLALIKTLAPNQQSSFSIGEVVNYEITITNQGTVPSNDYTVVDQIPAGMTFISASDFGVIGADGLVTWSKLPNINPGDSKLLTIALRMDDTSLDSYRNIAEITEDSASDYGVTDKDSTTDSDLTNDLVVNHNDSTIDDVPGDEDDNDIEDINAIQAILTYDLALIKTLADGQATSVAQGEVVNYQIRVVNQGSLPSNDYTVIDQIPAGMSFLTASDFGTNNAGIVTWSKLPSINPGEAKTLTLLLTMEDVSLDSYRNYAEISEDSSEDFDLTDEDSTPDADLMNDPVVNHNDPNADVIANDEDDNDYEDITPIQQTPIYDLALIKTLAVGEDAAFVAGGQATYNITVTNQGTVPSNDFTVIDAIPTGMSFISASDFGSIAGNTVTWSNLPNLNPGETKTMQLTLRMDDTSLDSYRNYAEISDDSSEDYGVTDEDSTPDADVMNDPAINHNDPTADTVAGDEDDNDYEDVSPIVPAAIYDLALIKTLADGQATTVAEGDEVTYLITVSNQGNVPSLAYSVSDQIPLGMEIVNASDQALAIENVAVWSDLESLEPGQTKVLSLTLEVTDASYDEYRNWAEISDDSSENYDVTDEDSSPDDDPNNDTVINHNDINADNITGDEDDHDYEDIEVTPTLNCIQATISASQNSICQDAGETISLSTTITSAGATYVWSPSATLNDAASATPIATPTATTTYTVVVTEANGCESTAQVTIDVLATPIPVIPEPTITICEGGEQTLSVGGGVSYIWSPANSLSDPTSPAPIATPTTTTTYTVTMTDSKGCTGTGQVSVSVETVSADAGPDQTICKEGSGTNLFASGGVAYAWSPTTGLSDPTDASPSAQPTETTTYTVIVTNENGCTHTDQATITVQDCEVTDPCVPGPVAIASSDITICEGSTAQLSVTGGVSYAWSPVAGLDNPSIANPAANPTTTTTYIVTITDENGCTATDDVTVTVTNNNTVSAGADQTICGGSTQLNASGGVLYIWSPAIGLSDPTSASPTVTPTETTTYTVISTDINGCSGADEVTITVSPITVNTGADQTICNDGSQAILSAGLSVGEGVSYQWSPSTGLSATDTPNPLASPAATTTYKVTVTNAEGCTGTSEVVVNVQNCEPTPDPCLSFAVVDFPDRTICAGNITQLEASGGVLYLWNPVAGLDNPTSANPTASPATTTTYTVTVTNAEGCTATDQILVSVEDGISVDAGVDQSIKDCEDGVQMNATGGIFYSWSPTVGLSSASVANPIATPTSTTTYSVTVTNAEGCTGVDEVTISVTACENPQPDPCTDFSIPTVTDVTICSGETTQLNATGGVLYFWNPVAGLNDPTVANPTVSPTQTTTYTVTVTNTDGCTATDQITINIASPVNANAGADQSITDCGDGAQLTATGGVAYQWGPATGLNSTSIASPIATPSTTTTYTVTVTNTDGCTSVDQVTVGVIACEIPQPDPCTNFVATDFPNQTICSGGTAQLNAAGGVLYLWNPVAGLNDPTVASPTVSPTQTTTYTVTVTNPDGCTATDQITINIASPVNANAGADQSITDCGDGAQLTATGGVAYQWSPATGLNSTSIASPIATPSTTITYTVTVTNTDGCTSVDQVTVRVIACEIPQPEEDIDGDGITDNIEIAIGTDPNDPCSNNYTPAEFCAFIMNNPNSPLATGDCDNGGVTNLVECNNGENPTDPSDDAEDNGTGNGTGCEDFVIYECPDKRICVGGTAQLVVNGGNRWVWSPATGLDNPTSDVPKASPTVTTTYTVTAYDANGCSKSEQVIVTVVDELKVYAGEDQTICGNESAQLDGQGGVSYVWSPTTGLSDPTIANPTATPSATTTYTVTVTNPMGCTGTSQVTITIGGGLTVDAGEDVMSCDGATQLSASGGSTYLWSPTAGLSDPTIANPMANPSSTTTYSVTVTDAAGCTGEDQVTVTIGNFVVKACDDKEICTNGNVELLVTQGANYQWAPATGLSDTAIPNPIANPTSTTTYSVIVTDENGCSGVDQVTVIVAPDNFANAGADIDICGGESTTLSASGGISYQWSPATGLSSTTTANPTATPSATTTYSVTVTNEIGCTSTDNIIINVTPLDQANAGPDVTSCNGEAVQLTASGGTSYQWSPATGLSSTTTANPMATPSTTTTYTVTVTNDGGCTGTDQVTVTVSDFVAEACEDKEMCVGESTQLLVSAGESYAWEPAGLLDDPTSPAPNANPAHTTTFSVTVTNAAGCTSVDEVILYVHLNISANAGPDVFKCPNIGTQLQATGGMNYEWSPQEGLSDPFIANPIANPGQTTVYTVEIMDFNGCMTSDELVYEIDTECTPPPCQGNIIDQEEVCADEDNFGRVCLPFSMEELATNYSITVDDLVVKPDHGCNFVPLYAYPYSILPTFGATGTFTIETWIIDGVSHSGSVNNMEELTAWMNEKDPTGNWTNITTNYYIQGGNPLNNYGDMTIMHQETWIESILNPSYTGIANSTLLEVDMMTDDNKVVTITNLTTGCSDEVTFRTCPTSPRCAQNILEDLYEVTTANCEEVSICFQIKLGDIQNYDILVDGLPYDKGFQGCFGAATYTYTYFSIPDQGTKGPYQISSWTVNNDNFSGSVIDLQALVNWMNEKDPTGNWVIDPITLSIQGGGEDSTYGKMEIVQVNTRSKATLDVNTRLVSAGTSLSFESGTHEVRFFNTVEGCSEIVTVIVACDSESELSPSAEADHLRSRSEQVTILDVMANDQANITSIEIIQTPAHGRAVVNADRTVSYEATAGYCDSTTPDHFRYRICNDKGCDEATVEVIVECPAMKVNTGFSPNNDGINDYLTIEQLENYPNNELIVFNRTGAIVFKQQGYNGTWDGSYKGLPLPDGTYFFILKDGNGKKDSGYIQINR